MTQTLNRADYCWSEASELLNLSTATIIDMVNNGTLEHTACGKRITRESLEAAMAPESEQKWLHGPLPSLGGYDRSLPIGRHSPAEKRLAAVGIRIDSDGDYWTPQGFFSDVDAYTPDQLEAIAAHLREREGGAE